MLVLSTIFSTSLEHAASNVKGKAIPFQPRTGPEGSRRLGLPVFKTISM
jgi:hypothetical protein